MFVRIVHHWCKQGEVEAGRIFMDEVGNAISTAAGFLYRYRMEQLHNPDILTTLTAWQDEAAFEAFQCQRKQAHPAIPHPFERVEHEAYFVAAEIRSAVATRDI